MPRKIGVHFLLAQILMAGSAGVGAMPRPEEAAVQGSLGIESDSSDGSMRQAKADPQGFDSGLWRAEYMTQPADDSGAEGDPSIAVRNGAQAVGGPAVLVPRSKDHAFGSLIYSDNLAMVPIEIPVVINKSEFQAVHEADADLSTPALSDWEYASVTATGSKTIGFTTSGPSATSAIVGCIGILIVIGAYVSSGERRQ
ncbi:MAG: hypothetical protein R3C17_05610 [Planctomycetaceae bacterium]